jgi:hypothetical protein
LILSFSDPIIFKTKWKIMFTSFKIL